MNVDQVFRAYVVCALWSSTGDDERPLDAVYNAGDLAPEAYVAMVKDVREFVAANKVLLEGIEEDCVGHDFWLTRNGHGAGFWDRGLGQVGQDLTEACKPFGTSELYVGDDGQLYVM